MSADKNVTGTEGKETGEFGPSPSLVAFLNEQRDWTDDFYRSLAAVYEPERYEEFETQFIELRDEFKLRSQIRRHPDYEFLNRSVTRKECVGEILRWATEVAREFQRAREANRLDRSGCTDLLANLRNAIINLINSCSP
jgi:hypothetical protein